MSGLLRGDLKNRTEALARAIHSGQLTPNEVRAMDNRPAIEGGDNLFIQSGSVPVDVAAEGESAEENPYNTDDGDNEDGQTGE